MKKIKRKNKAFTLLEMCLVIITATIMLSSVVSVYLRSVYSKAGEKIALDISAIQEAGRAFYISNDRWPADIDELKTNNFLPATWNQVNPFNHAYTITTNANTFTVETQVDKSITRQVAGKLPTSTIANEDITSSVLIPGALAETGLPRGSIIMWSGTLANVPTGFAVCDGTNGTPDLRDKFVVGARADMSGQAETYIEGSYSKQGGSISHNHSGNTGGHALTIPEMPSHNHNMVYWHGNSFMPYTPTLNARSSNIAHTQSTTNTGGNQMHNHSISNDSHLNPYYAVVFIMQL